MSWLTGLGRGISEGGRTLGDYFQREHERKRDQETWETRRKASEEEEERKQGREQKQWEDRAAKTIQQNKDLAVWNQNYKADLETFAESPEMKAMVMEAALPGADQRKVMGAVAFMNAKKRLSRYEPLDDSTMKALEAFVPPGAVNKLMEKNMEAIKFRTDVEQENKRIAAQEKYYTATGVNREAGREATQGRYDTTRADKLRERIATKKAAKEKLLTTEKIVGSSTYPILESMLKKGVKGAGVEEALAAVQGRVAEYDTDIKELEDELKAMSGGGQAAPAGQPAGEFDLNQVKEFFRQMFEARRGKK